MKNHLLNWWPLYLLIGWIALGLTAMAMFAQGANPARSYGALDVITTTNFAGVTFAPVPCSHPGCGDSHSVLATERYITVRDTWAEVVDAAGKATGENRRLHSITNDWGSLSFEISHPAIYRMHTQPGYPVRPGTRWPGDLPPLPPWETADASKAPKRSNAATLPHDMSDPFKIIMSMSPRFISNRVVFDTNPVYGVLYSTDLIATNGPILEKRSTDRLSGVQVWPGDAVERVTNQPAVETSSLKASIITTTNALVFSTNSFSFSYITFDEKVTTTTNPTDLKMVFHSRDGTTWSPVWTERTGPEGSITTRPNSTYTTNEPAAPHRFRAVPATNALPQARRFNP